MRTVGQGSHLGRLNGEPLCKVWRVDCFAPIFVLAFDTGLFNGGLHLSFQFGLLSLYVFNDLIGLNTALHTVELGPNVLLHRPGPFREILLELLPLLGVLGGGSNVSLRWRVLWRNGLLRLTCLLEFTLHRGHATLGSLYVVQQLRVGCLQFCDAGQGLLHGFWKSCQRISFLSLIWRSCLGLRVFLWRVYRHSALGLECGCVITGFKFCGFFVPEFLRFLFG